MLPDVFKDNIIILEQNARYVHVEMAHNEDMC